MKEGRIISLYVNFYESEIWGALGWMFLTRDLSCSYSKGVARFARAGSRKAVVVGGLQGAAVLGALCVVSPGMGSFGLITVRLLTTSIMLSCLKQSTQIQERVARGSISWWRNTKVLKEHTGWEMLLAHCFLSLCSTKRLKQKSALEFFHLVHSPLIFEVSYYTKLQVKVTSVFTS